MPITTEQIRTAIQAFLHEQHKKKAEAERKRLAKAEAENDDAAMYDARQKLADYQHKYDFHTWLAEDAMTFTRQLRFGTHISKGIHPDSRGDNINFQAEGAIPEYLIGSHNLSAPKLDANGNAAALPLAAFFDSVVDAATQTTLRDLLLQNHPTLSGAFADNPDLSAHYQSAFQDALRAMSDAPATHERNKQMLWPLDENAIAQDAYINLIPLYPSALTHHIYQTIQSNRYDDAQKEIRKRRREGKGEQTAHNTFAALAYVQLGGTKPQNISQLNSKQGGCHFLMPSLPPQYEAPKHPHLRKTSESFFNNALRYQCRNAMHTLQTAVRAKKNNIDIRELREQALDEITCHILILAESMRERRQPGWSREYPELHGAEKYWLDTGYQSDGHEDDSDWQETIASRFALWFNQWLRDKFKSIADDFDQAEYQEWRKTMMAALKAAERRKPRSAV